MTAYMRGASGTARKASGAAGSPAASRIEDRAPFSEGAAPSAGGPPPFPVEQAERAARLMRQRAASRKGAKTRGAMLQARLEAGMAGALDKLGTERGDYTVAEILARVRANAAAGDGGGA